VDGLRRSPGFASEDVLFETARSVSMPIRFCSGLPGIFQWPAAMFSLTVARQRGILTRFPVFAE